MIACYEIISVKDILSTKKTNAIVTNVTKNCRSKKVRYKIDYYILHTVSNHITIDSYTSC